MIKLIPYTCIIQLLLLWSIVLAQSSSDLKAAYQNGLVQHNYYRQKHHVGNLVLDAKLCAIAQKYAEYLAKNNMLKHSGSKAYGENLFMYGTTSRSKPEIVERIRNAVVKATDSWYNEGRTYNFHSGQYSSHTGHFTQVVWKASKKVGFGVGFNNGRYYVVANYSPPGNVLGSFKSNVLKARRKRRLLLL